MKFLNSKQKRAVQQELEEVYGIPELNYLLIEFGKKHIRGFSGNLTREEIFQLSELANIEVIGMYLISQKDDDMRLNFDAVSLFRNQITKKIVEIDKKQLDLWMRGYDLEISGTAQSGVGGRGAGTVGDQRDSFGSTIPRGIV